MTDKDILLKSASAIYSVYGNDDETLQINRVEIGRFVGNFSNLTIYLSRPALIIGKGGHKLNQLSEEITKEFGHIIKIKLIEHEPIPIISRYHHDDSF